MIKAAVGTEESVIQHSSQEEAVTHALALLSIRN